MQQEEIEEKVTMIEELFQGLVGRMDILETGMADFLKTFMEQYRNVLENIADRVETANKRYDDRKIQTNIDELTKIVSSMPKIVTVRNTHHFGAWSKSLIIGVVIAFVLTAGSIGTALYFNHQNNRLNSEAYNFWLVRAMYPEVSKTIEAKLTEDPNGFIQQAEKAMVKQQAIIAAEAEAHQAEQQQRAAKQRLEKVKSAK
ncbi:hypothetical protein [Mucilaginibacter lacusdianchii]|uniref:hypothetical protein n=1 Tax=Mucilaginibacter lacusdianchii TaxID=2684211 RepID=UPI00131E1880|nr:hypothetical protein [Mucilaginibacter sp. JXJ CY 39]